MFIKSYLFSKGHPATAQRSLSDLLRAHRQNTIDTIKGVSDLSLMTDSFLDRLVRDSLVEPLSFDFGGMTRKPRTERLNASYLPAGSMGARRYSRMGDFHLAGDDQKQVVRLSIPFSGDCTLPLCSPISTGLNLPQGEVSGNTVQFDVILWGTPEDGQRVPQEIRRNCELLASCAEGVNKQVKEFNESLPEQIKTAFAAKLEELTKQSAIFDNLGIPEGTEPPIPTSSPTVPRPKKGKARAEQIIQIVGTMYVQQLNQTNYNVGDVNNAIQSGE